MSSNQSSFHHRYLLHRTILKPHPVWNDRSSSGILLNLTMVYWFILWYLTISSPHLFSTTELPHNGLRLSPFMSSRPVSGRPLSYLVWSRKLVDTSSSMNVEEWGRLYPISVGSTPTFRSTGNPSIPSEFSVSMTVNVRIMEWFSLIQAQPSPRIPLRLSSDYRRLPPRGSSDLEFPFLGSVKESDYDYSCRCFTSRNWVLHVRSGSWHKLIPRSLCLSTPSLLPLWRFCLVTSSLLSVLTPTILRFVPTLPFQDPKHLGNLGFPLVIRLNVEPTHVGVSTVSEQLPPWPRLPTHIWESMKTEEHSHVFYPGCEFSVRRLSFSLPRPWTSVYFWSPLPYVIWEFEFSG